MDENGLLIGKDMPYAFSHRHYSHLLAIYPLYLLNTEQPGAVDTIEKSLAFWQSKPKALQGYSCTGASSISSAIGKGNDALSYLNKLFGKFLSPTTMYKEAGPVIETPLSGAQCIHDMLIQSWGGKIRISRLFRMSGKMSPIPVCAQKEHSKFLPAGNRERLSLYI